MGNRVLRGRQPIGVLRIGKAGKAQTVFIVNGYFIFFSIFHKAKCQHVCRHCRPKAFGCRNTICTKVITMVI
ncbi:hypothetical protein SDC9_113425 [bioreactor metagenome]|uniref:Uncharacterized protein n=1 Tax=bioreactor metagenome TaxID=1076179 RepID=A0A645BMC1_9ZZZZ